jgi:hypothetical protein
LVRQRFARGHGGIKTFECRGLTNDTEECRGLEEPKREKDVLKRAAEETRLLVSESHHGIDSRGASGRDVARGKRDHSEQDCDYGEG